MGRRRGGAGRRHSVLGVRGDRDDREPVVPRPRRGRSTRSRSPWSARASSASSASSQRSPPRSSPALSSGPSTSPGSARLARVGARAVDRPEKAGRAPAFLAHGAAGGARVARVRREARLGRSARDTLGAYWELWRGYDPLAVGKWFVYHLGDFAVYLAVVPVAVAPIVLGELGRAGRAGSRAGGGVRRAVRRRECVGAARRRRVHEHAVGLRPAPRPLRVLPRAAVARGPGVWLASGLPRPPSRPRSARSPRSRWCWSSFARAGERGGIDTVPGALWVRSRRSSRGRGLRPADSPSRSSSSGCRGDVPPAARHRPPGAAGAVAVGSRRCRTSPGSA